MANKTTQAIGQAFVALNSMLGQQAKRREPEDIAVTAPAPERPENLEHREVFEAVQAQIKLDASLPKPTLKPAKKKKRYLFS